MKLKRLLSYNTFWLLILICLSVASISIGVENFSITSLLKGESNDITLAVISRIPRLMSIIITGAGLAIAGQIMQALTKNKFVSPSTAGTMEWCKLGIMLAITVFANAGSVVQTIVAFIISLIGTTFFMFILNRIKVKDSAMVPLIGIMLGGIVSAFTSFVAFRLDIIQNINSWLNGSLSLITQGKYEMLYIGLPFLILGYIYADKFTISGMGEDFAKGLGINHKAVVFIGLGIIAMITSSVVVTVGSIPFIGLVIPNIVSMFKGDNLKGSILLTAIVGSVFVLVCDIIGRLIIFPYEISVSLIISVIGSAVFLTMLLRRNKNA